MKKILNITNGDSAVAIMQKAHIPGIFLPWRDVLHDGPVPADLSLEQLSKIRAAFIVDRQWGEAKTIKQHFIERDNTLKVFQNFEKIILWFEHDLYDQLQLIQILDWFHHLKKGDTKLSLICEDQYLGILTPGQMLGLKKLEKPVTENQFTLASKAWAAFRAPTPEHWFNLLDVDTSELPFLQGTIKRMLEEYPSTLNGLSRTAHQALNIIVQGEISPGNLFGLYQETEQRRFLGDSSFWVILNELLAASPPLLKLSEGRMLKIPVDKKQTLTISQTGRDVFSGKRNFLEFTQLNRWIGGVNLSDENVWCWDRDSQTLLKCH